MRKDPSPWLIEKLIREYPAINFPEYQREPNVWSRREKQRLVDSILRQFDIASIYLYEESDGSLDCIDGRQRLGAIMSFLGENPDDEEDQGFRIKFSNEIYPDDDPPFAAFDGSTWQEVQEEAENNPEAARLVKTFLKYPITVVKLSGSERAEEFNLQFTRLNLGAIINSGEKLNAMVGEMHDLCFDKVVHNPYLEMINIPTRRFAREQVAAQILAQVFSRSQSEQWTSTRHYDLQRFFKEHTKLTEPQRELVERVEEVMTLLSEAFTEPEALRNRAMSVSAVLLGWQEDIRDADEAKTLAQFVEEFVCRLRWQMGRMKQGFGVDTEYRYLMEFQRHVTQASVEKYAVEGRANTLLEQFAGWKADGMIGGDQTYRQEKGSDPAAECRGG